MFAEVLGGRDVRSVRAGELGLCDLNGEPRPSALLPMSRALSEGIPVQEEMLLGGFDGSRRIMVQAAPFFAHDRIVTHVIVALYDVTRLQALETFRQRWTSAIAHDIKTPLTASRLALQHLLMRITRLGSLSDTGTLQLLNRQIDRVIRLLNLMLDVSRLTEGRLTLDMRSHDYLSLAGAVVEEWQVAFPDASIQLETEVVPPLMVQMDGDRIEELLGNLLSNAIKYSVSSRPEVRVHVSVRGDRVITRIIDRGLGMSDEQARVIFDLYQRGGREQGPIDGEGLGAFVAYELAKMHGGLLTVERTSIGEGTTMLLELPVSAITRQVRESA
jgi:signal transduction histidine kinase